MIMVSNGGCMLSNGGLKETFAGSPSKAFTILEGRASDLSKRKDSEEELEHLSDVHSSYIGQLASLHEGKRSHHEYQDGDKKATLGQPCHRKVSLHEKARSVYR